VRNDAEKPCISSLDLPLGNTVHVLNGASTRTKSCRMRKVNCNISIIGTSSSVVPNTNDMDDDIIKVSENTIDINSYRTKAHKMRKVDHKNEIIGMLPPVHIEARQNLFPSNVICQSNYSKGIHSTEAVPSTGLEAEKLSAGVFLSIQNSKNYEKI